MVVLTERSAARGRSSMYNGPEGAWIHARPPTLAARDPIGLSGSGVGPRAETNQIRSLNLIREFAAESDSVTQTGLLAEIALEPLKRSELLELLYSSAERRRTVRVSVVEATTHFWAARPPGMFKRPLGHPA